MDLESLIIEAAARIAHEVNRAYCEAMGDHSQPSWNDAPMWQKNSAIAGMTYLYTHHTAGPATSHEGWMKLKLEEGWVYGTVKDTVLKTHPNLVSFHKLPLSERVKDHLFLAVAKVTMTSPLETKEETPGA